MLGELLLLALAIWFFTFSPYGDKLVHFVWGVILTLLAFAWYAILAIIVLAFVLSFA